MNCRLWIHAAAAWTLLAAPLGDGSAQLLMGGQAVFTRADSLRGGLRQERTCYDVKFYRLKVRVDPAEQAVSGSNAIDFLVLAETRTLQVDLFRNMEIDRITLGEGAACAFTRDGNAVFVAMPRTLRQGEQCTLLVEYHGKPRVARMPPWDGGFIWTHDSSGSPWVAVACQGTGASLWWPNKDHPSDEPDSMAISVTVPPGLQDISNGRLRRRSTGADGWTTFDWFVSSPVNNYCVTVNVGKFARFGDVYDGRLTLDYYVLPQDLESARRQFAQVRAMLEAFEHFFGPYPFPRDGYKLVQSPHLGMEHQGCVAYGNGFRQGYRGHASSPEGLLFDFIIVHESAHEWWGNSLTASDNADMWIHESFGAYAEALFVEYWHGRDSSLQYINAKRPNVGNAEPMQGPPGVNKEGAKDMYDKGQLVLNTLRSALGSDSLWFSILRGMQERFRWKTIAYDTVVAYMSQRSGTDLAPFFDQYFRHASLPRLDLIVTKRGDTTTLRTHWHADVPGFAMPAIVHLGPGRSLRLSPTSSWNTLRLEKDADPCSLTVDDRLMYIESTITRNYLDPHAPRFAP